VCVLHPHVWPHALRVWGLAAAIWLAAAALGGGMFQGAVLAELCCGSGWWFYPWHVRSLAAALWVAAAALDSTLLKSDSTHLLKSDSTHLLKSDSTHLLKSDSTHLLESDSTHLLESDLVTHCGPDCGGHHDSRVLCVCEKSCAAAGVSTEPQLQSTCARGRVCLYQND
jgi:hypothetical protein